MPRNENSPKRKRTTLKSDPRSLQRRDRALEALRLRREGKEFREIAELLDYKTASGVWEAVQKLLETQPKEDREAMRRIDDERLNEMLVLLREAAQRPGRGAARAAEVYLKALERRARMWGLDEADKLEVSGADGPIILEFTRDDRQDEHQREVKERGLDQQ